MFANINAQDANGVVPGATITGMAKDLWGTTGGRIKWARMRAGMTQAALGHAVGVKNVYISQLENNVHDASRTRMKMIAAATGVSLGFLELETEDPAPPQVDEPEPPVYFSPQADEAAQLIDAMSSDEWRNLALQMIQLLAMHAGSDTPDDESSAPAPGIGGRLILGKLIAGLKKSSEAPGELLRRERASSE